ncbi:MAG TPA: glycosyltransferase family 2 protein, partial [Armatimonadota bacterium]
MTYCDPVLLALSLLSLFFWLEVARVHLIPRRRLTRLADLPEDLPAGRPWPRLAVIVPCMNEGVGVSRAVASLLEQDYPDLRVISIDDRSTDDTGRLLEEAAAHDPRLSVLHVTELPPNWLGKNHANWLGWRAAEEGAEWLLFTDGDVRFRPGALKRAVARGLASGAGHVTAFPQLELGGFTESAFLCAFVVWFGIRFRPQYAGAPGSRWFLGIGAFNLVRRDAYEAVGTHEALRLTLADDMALGKLLHQSGHGQAVLSGDDQVVVRWQAGLAATVRGLYKSAFASLSFSVPMVVASCLGLLLTNLYPWLALEAHGTARAAGAAALALLCATYYTAARTLGHGRLTSLALALTNWVGGLLFLWL